MDSYSFMEDDMHNFDLDLELDAIIQWVQQQVLPNYIEFYHDFDFKPKSVKDTWKQIIENFQKLRNSLIKQVNHSKQDKHFHDDNSNQDSEVQSDSQSFIGIIDNLPQDLVAQSLNSDGQDLIITKNTVHIYCSVILYLCVRSQQSQTYIHHITDLDSQYQEVIMKILERLGLSGSRSQSQIMFHKSYTNSNFSSPTKFNLLDQEDNDNIGELPQNDSGFKLRMISDSNDTYLYQQYHSNGGGYGNSGHKLYDNQQFLAQYETQRPSISRNSLLQTTGSKQKILNSSQKEPFDTIAKIQDLETEKRQLSIDNDNLKIQVAELNRKVDELNVKSEHLYQEKQKLHDQLLKYEVMETDQKALQKEMKNLKFEKVQQIQDLKQRLLDKHEELELTKDLLMKKEGIESKIEDYKNKLEILKDAVDIKNQTLLQMKDLELQLRESQNQTLQLQKLAQKLKEEVIREKDTMVSKDTKIMRYEQEIDMLKEDNKRYVNSIDKKDEQLKQYNRQVIKQQTEIEELQEQLNKNLINNVIQDISCQQQQQQQPQNPNYKQDALNENSLEIMVLELKDQLFYAQIENENLKKVIEQQIKDYRPDKIEKCVLIIDETDENQQYLLLNDNQKKSFNQHHSQDIEDQLRQKISILEENILQLQNDQQPQNNYYCTTKQYAINEQSTQESNSLLQYKLQNYENAILELKESNNSKEALMRSQSSQIMEKIIENQNLRRTAEELNLKLDQLGMKYKQLKADILTKDKTQQLFYQIQKDQEMEIKVKQQESESLKNKIQELENLFKDKMAQELKKVIKQSREKERLKLQLEQITTNKQESEIESKNESFKYIENMKSLGVQLEKLKTTLQGNTKGNLSQRQCSTTLICNEDQKMISNEMQVNTLQSRNEIKKQLPTMMRSMKAKLGNLGQSRNDKNSLNSFSRNYQSMNLFKTSNSNTLQPRNLNLQIQGIRSQKNLFSSFLVQGQQSNVILEEDACDFVINQ
ncbi:UNKNOWN [Stylonychia lemnae]|uniref:Uncharacterized protein n=1 Tax=Stylonychia lemnae TaxID=5949 RepID=A0A078BAK9_STYLE|nr:UNKNOWN [Stylonychia lemnae]|eukprot:CDW90603.1 UNKNOWN [Stylonychia lemnae]